MPGCANRIYFEIMPNINENANRRENQVREVNINLRLQEWANVNPRLQERAVNAHLAREVNDNLRLQEGANVNPIL